MPGLSSLSCQPKIPARYPGCDDPVVHVDSADAVVAGIRDVQVPFAVYRDPHRSVQACLDRLASIAGIISLSIAGDSGHNARLKVNAEREALAKGPTDAISQATLTAKP